MDIFVEKLHDFEHGPKEGEEGHRDPPFFTDFAEASLEGSATPLPDKVWTAAKCSFLGGSEEGFVDELTKKTDLTLEEADGVFADMFGHVSLEELGLNCPEPPTEETAPVETTGPVETGGSTPVETGGSTPVETTVPATIGTDATVGTGPTGGAPLTEGLFLSKSKVQKILSKSKAQWLSGIPGWGSSL